MHYCIFHFGCPSCGGGLGQGRVEQLDGPGQLVVVVGLCAGVGHLMRVVLAEDDAMVLGVGEERVRCAEGVLGTVGIWGAVIMSGFAPLVNYWSVSLVRGRRAVGVCDASLLGGVALDCHSGAGWKGMADITAHSYK